MKNSTKRLQLLCFAALFLALIFLFTYSLKIPSIGFGYKHIGDAFIYLAACFLNPWLSFFVSALGSALSDFVGGYSQFILGTFLIKGFNGLLVSLLMQGLRTYYLKKRAKSQPSLPAVETMKELSYIPTTVYFLCFLLFSALAGLSMVAGYFLYESLLFGTVTALATWVGNLGQALTSLLVACFLILPLKRLLPAPAYSLRPN